MSGHYYEITQTITDLFADWKTNKFIVYDNSLHPENVIVLSDWKYWTEHYEEVQKWCEKYGCTLSGMIVTIPDEQIMTLFILQWS